MDFIPSAPILSPPSEAGSCFTSERKAGQTMKVMANSLIEDRVYKDCQVDKELAALLEPFRGLAFPLSPKYFIEECEFYVTPRYLTSSLTKQDLDNLCAEAEFNLAQKEYAKAATLFKEVCYYNHHDARGWQGLARCYVDDQNFAQTRILYSIAGSIFVTEILKIAKKAPKIKK